MLVCDLCDKGYHTYCLQPVMDAIPTGGWRCQVDKGKGKGKGRGREGEGRGLDRRGYGEAKAEREELPAQEEC